MAGANFMNLCVRWGRQVRLFGLRWVLNHQNDP